MKDACRISAQALRAAGEAIRPGVSTLEIDTIVRHYIEKQGATPSFLGYGGFPASACISVNNVVIHGIPDKYTVLREGDIVSVDTGAYYKGYHGDNAYTFACGRISENAEKLLNATRESLYEGIKQATVGNRIGDIGSAVQRYVEARSYSVDPSVPNYGTPHRGLKLLPGMTIAIEPMVNEGTYHVRVMPDKWTVKTVDGKLSAHFEHTVAITPDGPRIMTICD